MAGTQINDYGVGDTNLTSLMNTADTQRIGYHSVSLTNYATTTVPAVAEGSVVEIAGALFEFQADEAISGSPANGTVYIKLTPSGTSVTAAFSTVAPSWDDEKQGWYEAASNNRYLNFGMIKSGASYTKYHLPAQATVLVKAYPNGRLQCDDLYVDNDIIMTGEITDGTTSIYGYLDDGTKLFAKRLTGTFGAGGGDLCLTMAHGLGAIVSGGNVVHISVFITKATNDQIWGVSEASLSFTPKVGHIDDTNLYIVRGVGSAADPAFALIVYKK